jgi:hypothetical protein
MDLGVASMGEAVMDLRHGGDLDVLAAGSTSAFTAL